MEFSGQLPKYAFFSHFYRWGGQGSALLSPSTHKVTWPWLEKGRGLKLGQSDAKSTTSRSEKGQKGAED